MKRRLLILAVEVVIAAAPTAVLCAQNEPDLVLDPSVPIHIWPQKLTVRVVDEQGAPVDGAEVAIGMRDTRRFSSHSNIGTGKSAADGRFSYEALGEADAWVRVDKPGYFRSRTTYKWDIEVFDDYDPDSGVPFVVPDNYRAEPWNPEVEIVLVKIGEGQVLVERATAGRVPENPPAIPDFGRVVEFDLVEGELLPPLGGGKHADLRFTSHHENVENLVHYILGEMEFLGQGNGMIPVPDAPFPNSEFKYLREAPGAGYHTKLLERATSPSVRPPDGSLPPPRAAELRRTIFDHVQRPPRLPLEFPEMWVFRIRNDLAAEGKGPIYGVIYGPIMFSASPDFRTTSEFDFALAFNPEPGNRNLERKVREIAEFPPGVPPPPPPPAPADAVPGADEVDE